MKSISNKAVVIGLDGATFDIIAPLINEGKLPNLAKLIMNGVSGPLTSSLMPNSFPSWSSCITGVNPGKHGIFWSLIRNEKTAYPLDLMGSHDIQAKKIWEILGEHDRTSVVVNVPTEFPPYPINGSLVCGALTPDRTSAYTYPPGLKEEILATVPEYRCEIDFAGISLHELAAQLLQSIENRENVILHLMKRKPWDLFFAVFTETDLAQHKFWAGIDPHHPLHDQVKGDFGTFVYDIYERLDVSVGKILSEVPSDTPVFIVSDHGFGPFYQSFSIQQWLIDHDYLVSKESLVKRWIKRLLMSTGFLTTARIFKNRLRSVMHADHKVDVRGQRERDAMQSETALSQINWRKTRAYFTSDFGIRVNLKEREPEGIVPQGTDDFLLKEEILTRLNSLKFSNGNPVFEEVVLKETAFSGPHVDRAADIIVPINHPGAPPKSEKWRYTLIPTGIQGTHTPAGIFIAAGGGIKINEKIKSAEIIDITPTLLYCMDLPLSKDMDGKVLKSIFPSEFGKNRKIRRKGSSLKSRPGWKPSPDGEEEVVERLRSLGYID